MPLCPRWQGRHVDLGATGDGEPRIEVPQECRLAWDVGRLNPSAGDPLLSAALDSGSYIFIDTTAGREIVPRY